MCKYFSGCKTKQQLKVRFKTLIKENHPDNGGDLETMQTINAEYDRLVKILPDIPGSETEMRDEKEKFARKPEPEKTETDFTDLSDAVKQAIARATQIPGIEVEVCGSWVWVSGNTYAVKNTLKEIGFRFSGKKKMWYFHEEIEGRKYFKRKREMDMGSIRSKYGTETMYHREVCLG